MALPITVPNTFATETTNIPLSDLDDNFTTVADAVNGIGSGSEALANVAITGGSITGGTMTNVTVTTISISNVAITGGSITGITDLAVVDGGTGASNAASARTNLGAAASGSNSDITALSGLTTALSIAQGGTGANTAATARTSLGLGTLATQNSVTAANMFAGAVLQVVQVVKSNTFSTTSSSYTDITGMSASITPRDTSSKILVFVDMKVSGEDNAANTFRLMRGATEIGGSSGTNGGFATVGNAAFFRPAIWQVGFTYLDSPSSSSSVTYKVQGLNSSGVDLTVNYAFSSAVLGGRVSVSTITLVEIAG